MARAIVPFARELEKQGLMVDWSTIRLMIKKQEDSRTQHNTQGLNSDTILTLGPSKEMTKESSA